MGLCALAKWVCKKTLQHLSSVCQCVPLCICLSICQTLFDPQIQILWPLVTQGVCDLKSPSRSITILLQSCTVTLGHCTFMASVTFDLTRSLWHSISFWPMVTLKATPRSLWPFGHSQGHWQEKCHVFHYFHLFSRSPWPWIKVMVTYFVIFIKPLS